jgi:hypothetical protein
MATMVYDESYGELTYAQRAAYRRHNVSPSDHDELVDTYGETAHQAITLAVKQYTRNGMFSSYLMREAHLDAFRGY